MHTPMPSHARSFTRSTSHRRDLLSVSGMGSVFLPGRMRARQLLAVAGVTAGSVLAVAATGSTNSSAFARCQPSQLHLAASFYGEAGGQFIQTFTFTNISPRVCRMAGWPRLEIEVASHRPVPVRTQRVVQGPLRARPFASVLLRADGAASFNVYGADWDFPRNRSCPLTTAALVTPAGRSAALRVGVRIPNCPGGFEIAPVIAGRTDRQSWSFVWHR
jgi:hypothetical protein